MNYLKAIWKSRFFWIHLAGADLKAKYRRSYFGVLWSIMQPLGLTLLLAVVMGTIFKMDIIDYAPFIFSGLIVWEFIINSCTGGCNAFINAEAYIKQHVHPVSIYPLRTVLSSLFNMAMGFLGLIVWVLIWRPENFGWSWLSIPVSMFFLFFTCWPMSVICAFIGTRYRDFSQLITLILQMVWYVSPVFFTPKLFISAGIEWAIKYNPVYHLLQLFRAPMLDGHFPTLFNYAYTTFFIIILWMLAITLIVKKERRVIFYL